MEERDYNSFGMKFENSDYVNRDNKYLYYGKELIEHSGLECYDYGAWFYDAQLGRWHVVDPAVEDNHFEWSPYTYVYNNPVLLIDPFGLDSAQRAQAVEKAKEYVEKKPKGNSFERGGTDQPGGKVDCSGMVGNCIEAGEEPDPVETTPGVYPGCQKLIHVSKEVKDENKLQEGNIVIIFDDDNQDYPAHSGIITKVLRDENDNVYEINLVHSRPTEGPTNDNMLMSSKWGHKKVKFYKWDTRPDVPDLEWSKPNVTTTQPAGLY